MLIQAAGILPPRWKIDRGIAHSAKRTTVVDKIKNLLD